jgi:adenine-specific DNA-methyltransferase
VKRWSVEFEEQYLIKIESSENNEHPWSKLPADKAEKVFAKTYPAIYGWFTSEDHRQQLIDRTDQGRYYWELRSCAYWEEFAHEKIVFPDIALSPQFATERDGRILANTSYMIPKADAVVLASVNSSISAWFYAQISPSIQNGYYRFIAQYVGQIPIPNATEMQRVVLADVCEILSLGISRPEYERLLNGLVYELFFPEDLHAKNIRLFDACTAAGIGQWPQANALAADTPKGKKDVANAAFVMTASSTAEKVFHPSHPIYGQLFELQTLEVVRLIEGDV